MRPLPLLFDGRPIPPPPPPYRPPAGPGAAPAAGGAESPDRSGASNEEETSSGTKRGPVALPPRADPSAPPRAPEEALRALALVYRDLDAEIARLAPRCDARGVCCDFDLTDHVLYASALEMALVMDRVPRERWARESGNRCPLLEGGRCGAREVRMLGCRAFFCQEGWEPIGAELYERHHARVKEIAARFGLGWRYAPALAQLREKSADSGNEASVTPH